MHIRAGHDNDLDYLYTAGSVTVAEVARSNTPGAEYVDVDCTRMPLKAGMTRNLDGTATAAGGYAGAYFASPSNPTGLDPQTGGYFENFDLTIEDYGSFKISSHTTVGGNARYRLVKKRALDTWITSTIPAAARVKIGWVDKDTSAKYADSLIELHKKEAGDADWVLVSSFLWPITFNAGASPASAGNPPGWNNFQPTGYANIDDNNPPGNRTIWTRFAEVILSKSAIGAPTL
jgi:hypothetical protein